MKTALLFILGLLIATIFVQAINFAWHVKIGKNLAKKAIPFSYTTPNASLRILVVGDSTAYGTGVKNPQQSTAGWFYQDFPQAEIVNISSNGAKINEIKQMLSQAEGKFDLVLVQGGANDIIYFKPLEQSKRDIADLLQTAKKYSDNVMLLTSGNIGAAPIFPFPLSWIYTQRAKKFLAEFEQVAKKNQVLFVKLYQDKKDDIFINDIKKYYAEDGLHLTGEGYKSWYEQIRKTMAEASIELK